MKNYRLVQQGLLVYLFVVFLALPCRAAEQPIFVHKVDGPVSEVMEQAEKSLQAENFFAIFQADIGANLKNFADQWGGEYNKNRLQGFRSMVICNGWWANRVSNLDPDALALCPLRITFVQKDGATRILFARPSLMVPQSKAREALEEIEQIIIKALSQVH